MHGALWLKASVLAAVLSVALAARAIPGVRVVKDGRRLAIATREPGRLATHA